MDTKIKKIGLKNICIDWFNVILWVSTCCVVSYVSYRMVIGDFASDYPKHIKSALTEGKLHYSLMSFIIAILYKFLGNNYGIAIFMGVVSAVTGLAIRYLILAVLKFCNFREVRGWPDRLITTVSYGLLCLSSFHIPGITPFYILNDANGRVLTTYGNYLTTFITQPWHNSTYSMMRLFGIICFVIFIKIWMNRENKISIKEHLLFVILLTLTNMIKPSFVIAFAPALFLFCLLDCMITHWKNVKVSLLLGLEIVISLLVLLYQYKVLYPVGGSSGISVTTNVIKSYWESGFLIPVIITNFMFPIIVTVISVKRKRRNSILMIAWILEVVAIIEKMIFVETGERALASNFGWGKFLPALILFTVCFCELFQLEHDQKNKYSTALVISAAIFLLHIISGFLYFGAIYCGFAYGDI